MNHHCSYCGQTGPDDRRGGCCACGAPREHPTFETPRHIEEAAWWLSPQLWYTGGGPVVFHPPTVCASTAPLEGLAPYDERSSVRP